MGDPYRNDVCFQLPRRDEPLVRRKRSVLAVWTEYEETGILARWTPLYGV
jgi:hypothetical protein